MGRDRIGIVGAGHAGRALAAHFSAQGYEVRIGTRTPVQVEAIRRHGVIEARGVVEGRFPVAEVTSEPERLAETSEVIFIASASPGYSEVARAFGPYLTRGHLIVLYSAKLCGSLELVRAIGLPAMDGPAILEIGSLFDCAAQDDDAIWFRSVERWTLFSAVQRSETMRLAARIHSLFPELEPADNLVQRGLSDFDAMAHAVISLANLSRIGRPGAIRFDHAGLSKRTIALLALVEREFAAVCQAYGSTLITVKDRLDAQCGDSGALLANLLTSPSCPEGFSPTRIDQRFVREGVMSTLLPVRGLAKKACVDTPLVDDLITFLSTFLQDDFTEKGRSLEPFGWRSLSRDEIVRWMQS